MIPSSKCRPYTCHSICVTERAVGPLIPAWRHHDCEFIFSHSSLSPPFHHTTTCPTNTGRCNGPRGDKAIENAHGPRPGGRTPRLSRTNAVRARGSPRFGESPQKIGWWGAKRVEERETRLTMSAFSLPQLTHMHSSIFFTFTMKPEGLGINADQNRYTEGIISPGWNTGLANSI